MEIKQATDQDRRGTKRSMSSTSAEPPLLDAECEDGSRGSNGHQEPPRASSVEVPPGDSRHSACYLLYELD